MYACIVLILLLIDWPSNNNIEKGLDGIKKAGIIEVYVKLILFSSGSRFSTLSGS